MKTIEFKLDKDTLHTITMKHIINDFEGCYYDSYLGCIRDFANISDNEKFEYISEVSALLDSKKHFTTAIFKKMEGGAITTVFFTFVVGNK